MPKVTDEPRLFSAALESLIADGYAGATTKAIADRAGVNEVTIYRKYGSKAGLFEKAIEHTLADTPLNRQAYTGDLAADLLAIVEAYLETNEQHGNIVALLLIEMPRNPDLLASFHTPWKNIQVIVEIIQRYQQQGQLKSETPLASLSALIGPLLIIQMLRRANPGLPLSELDPRAYVDSFLFGRKP